MRTHERKLSLGGNENHLGPTAAQGPPITCFSHPRPRAVNRSVGSGAATGGPGARPGRGPRDPGADALQRGLRDTHRCRRKGRTGRRQQPGCGWLPARTDPESVSARRPAPRRVPGTAACTSRLRSARGGGGAGAAAGRRARALGGGALRQRARDPRGRPARGAEPPGRGKAPCGAGRGCRGTSLELLFFPRRNGLLCRGSCFQTRRSRSSPAGCCDCAVCQQRESVQAGRKLFGEGARSPELRAGDLGTRGTQEPGVRAWAAARLRGGCGKNHCSLGSGSGRLPFLRRNLPAQLSCHSVFVGGSLGWEFRTCLPLPPPTLATAFTF
ncbi:uncharacterized protein LOC114677561 [Macaca mulatta]